MLESVSGLVVVVGHGLAVDHYLECNDRPSTLCLTQGYSTFELPLRNKANLIKIGEGKGLIEVGYCDQNTFSF